MKTVFFCVCLLLLSGCGERAVVPLATRRTAPALKEATPPPSSLSEVKADEQIFTDRYNPPAEITGNTWVERQTQKAEQLESLRAYAAQADPDDPFALTEARIEALSQHDELVFQ